MNDFENLQEARKVIEQRAIDNRTKNINENLKYRMKISETKEEKIACETILNSQYSLDDKEWLFNGGLFRTDEELEFFKKEKEKEKFIESGEWEKFNRKKCHWVWLLPIIDAFFFYLSVRYSGELWDFCTSDTIMLYTAILFIPLLLFALIVKALVYRRIEIKAEEMGINDELAEKARIKHQQYKWGAIGVGAAGLSAGAKSAKEHFGYKKKK